MEPLHRLAFLFFRTVDQKMSALNMLTIRGIPRTAGRMPKMPRKNFLMLLPILPTSHSHFASLRLLVIFAGVKDGWNTLEIDLPVRSVVVDLVFVFLVEAKC